MLKMRNVSIAIAGVACVAIGSAVAPNTAQAAIITNNFRVDVTTGSLANQSFFGNFSYDDDSLANTATQIIDPNNGNQLINPTNGLLSLAFNFLGITYTEKSDSGYSQFPQLNFKDGLFQGLDYVVEASPSVVLPGSISLFGTGYDTASGGTFFVAYEGDPNDLSTPFSEGTVVYSAQAVPTPALLPGLIGLGLSVWRKRKAEA